MADILADENVESKMRDKALQLLNVKLMQDGVFHKDGGIETKHLISFAGKLVAWIQPAEAKDEVCFSTWIYTRQLSFNGLLCFLAGL